MIRARPDWNSAAQRMIHRLQEIHPETREDYVGWFAIGPAPALPGNFSSWITDQPQINPRVPKYLKDGWRVCKVTPDGLITQHLGYVKWD